MPTSQATEKQPETLTRKATAGAGWSTIAVVARQLLSLGAVAVLARRLGPEAYGLMGMAATVTVFLNNFRDLGTAAAIIQRETVSQELLSTIFWANLGLGSILCGLLSLAAGPIAAFFHEPGLTGILRGLSVTFIFMATGIVHNSLLNRQMRFKQTAIADLVSAVAGYAVAVVMAIGGFGVWSLVYSTLTGSFATVLMYWVLSGWRPSFTFSTSALRSIARFSANLSGFGLVNYFSRNADNLIVGKFLGANPLGYYQMAYNLMMYPIQNVTSILSQVLLPAFSRIQNDNPRFRDAYVRSCMLIAMITFPVIAGMGAVADPLVRAVLGEKWAPVIPIFQILAPVGMFQSVQSTVGHIYVAKGRTDWMFRWGAFATAAFVASFLIGVRYGVIGVALAYAIVYFLITLYPALAIPFRLIDMNVWNFAARLWPQIAITSVMVVSCLAWLRFLTWAAVTNPFVQLSSAVLLGIVVYAGLMLSARPRVIYCIAEVLDEWKSGPAGNFAILFRRCARI